MKEFLRCLSCRKEYTRKEEVEQPHLSQKGNGTEYGSLHYPSCGFQTGIYKKVLESQTETVRKKE